MIILGISAFFHDSAVCIITDGEIIYAAQEERFSRIKNDHRFPSLAIKNALEYTNYSLNEFDAIVFYEKPFLKFERILTNTIEFAPKGVISFYTAMKSWLNEKLFIKQTIKKELKKIDSNYVYDKSKILFSHHHLSHAASTFFVSPFDEAVILTIDGVGEYTTTSIQIGLKNTITPLYEIHFPNSLGLFYSSITYFLGFKVNSDEYKVMGLAAYGNIHDESTTLLIKKIEEKLIRFNDDSGFVLNMNYFTFTHSLEMVDVGKWEKLFCISHRKPNSEIMQEHCNLALAFQKTLEKATLSLCEKAQKYSNNLCLAGGVALNCVINGIIKKSNLFDNVFIQPAANDAGGALGAALAAYYIHFSKKREVHRTDSMKMSMLGCDINENEIRELMNLHLDHKLYDCFDVLISDISTSIAKGKVIGWVQGRMEFGPRALGNRSILGDPTSTKMQSELNLKVKNRESFRPFAAAVLEEDANKYFDIIGGSPYMLEVYNVQKKYQYTYDGSSSQLSMQEKLSFKKSDFPAVTHVDYSARLQTVNKQQHPKFWKLINAIKQINGIGMIINTSFNNNNDPIVCSAKDAYSCFMNTKIDILVIQNVVFYK